MQLTTFIDNLKADIESGSNMEIGKVLKHPDGRTVKIMSGYFYDPTYNRVSNFWTWNEIKPDGSLGPEESGYGW